MVETARKPSLGPESGAEISLEYLEIIFGEDYLDRITGVLLELGLYTEENHPIFRNPLITHTNSQALYLLEDDRDDSIIYVQYMPQTAETSRHKHAYPVTESFHVLQGALYLNGLVVPPEGLVVKSDIYHQASAKDQPALTILITKNAQGISRDRLHIPEP